MSNDRAKRKEFPPSSPQSLKLAPREFVQRIVGSVSPYRQSNLLTPAPDEAALLSYSSGLLQAAQDGNVDEVEKILTNDPNLCAQASNRFGVTALHKVCSRSTSTRSLADMVRSLIAHGANVRSFDDLGRSPMFDACWSVDPDFAVVDILLAQYPQAFFDCDTRKHCPLDFIPQTAHIVWISYLTANRNKIRCAAAGDNVAVPLGGAQHGVEMSPRVPTASIGSPPNKAKARMRNNNNPVRHMPFPTTVTDTEPRPPLACPSSTMLGPELPRSRSSPDLRQGRGLWGDCQNKEPMASLKIGTNPEVHEAVLSRISFYAGRRSVQQPTPEFDASLPFQSQRLLKLQRPPSSAFAYEPDVEKALVDSISPLAIKERGGLDEVQPPPLIPFVRDGPLPGVAPMSKSSASPSPRSHGIPVAPLSLKEFKEKYRRSPS